MHPALRVLARFWSVVGAALLGLVVLLALLGPVPPPSHPAARITGFAPPAARPAPAPPATANVDNDIDRRLHIADPQPSLLRAAAAVPGRQLPTPAGDILPMRVYARPFAPDRRPRVALLVDGIGLADIDSLDAIQRLPGPVDLAFSAYSPDPGPLALAARSFGHEYLISVPMEPHNYPQDDEGFRSLLVGADTAANARNLDWALTRLQGYVGATGASDGLRGERFAEAGQPYTDALNQIAADGLLYVDPRPAASLLPRIAGRSIDIVVDEEPNAAQIDARLGALELIARDRGAAIGLAGPLRPLTIERIALWARGLSSRGIVLAPISALIAKPADAPEE